MLILDECGIIRSLSRNLLGFVLILVVRKILTSVLSRCDVLGDILFICVEFIRVWVG